MLYHQERYEVLRGVFFFELVSKHDMYVYHRSNRSYNKDMLKLDDVDTSNFTKLGLPNEYRGQ